MASPWSLAVPDWQERIKAGRSLLPDFPALDRKEAARATGIFNKLRLPDVIGQPALADAGGAWFREIVGAVLGSVDRETGKRMLRELFLLAPKKSSKTSYGAAFMLTALLMNERPRAEFLLLAPTISTASLAFNQAIGMVLADPFLKKRLRVREHLRRITDERTKATLEIKSFETNVLTGVKPVGVLLDELHEIAKNPAAERIIGQIRGGILPNPEAFIAFITTQSDQAPRGAFKTELTTARKVRDGKGRSSMLSVLYEFPPDIANDKASPPAWEDSSNWWMVTPNLGLSVQLDSLQEEFAKAKEVGTAEVIRWASQHLNIEIGTALGSDHWPGAEHWDAAAMVLTLDELLERSEVVTMGGDGGGLDDLLGLAVLGREKGGRWLLWCWAACFAGVLERRKAIASTLRDLERAGELYIARTLGDDMEQLKAIAEKVVASGKLPDEAAVGLDPAGIGAVKTTLQAAGVTEEQCAGISQGWRLSGAIGTAERALADGTLKHAGQRLMAFCVSNAKVEPRGNARLITKQASGVGKIDPLMATFNAVSLMSLNPASGAVDVAAMIA